MLDATERQRNYDEGYEDGKKSRDCEIVRLESHLIEARRDLDFAREEAKRYRDMWDNRWETKPSESDDLPF